MTSIAELLAEGRARLSEAAFAPPQREAILLLGRTLGWSEAEVLARTDHSPTERELSRFRSLLERRLAGEPVAYLFGEREFYGRPFRVDPRVLIPRPESEHLIEAALGLSLPAAPRVLDVGTGSGCLAVTLALELNGAWVTATDRSLAALAVARGNAHHLARDLETPVRLLAADLTTALSLDRFDLVVSNPPYIATEEGAHLSPEILEHEPAEALFASEGGLGVIRRLLSSLRVLRGGAWVLLEIGRGQDTEVLELAADSGFEPHTVVPDLAGIPRIAVLRRSR